MRSVTADSPASELAPGCPRWPAASDKSISSLLSPNTAGGSNPTKFRVNTGVPAKCHRKQVFGTYPATTSCQLRTWAWHCQQRAGHVPDRLPRFTRHNSQSASCKGTPCAHWSVCLSTHVIIQCGGSHERPFQQCPQHPGFARRRAKPIACTGGPCLARGPATAASVMLGAAGRQAFANQASEPRKLKLAWNAS